MFNAMAIDIIMPPLSQTQDTLYLVKWMKKIGEAVTKGETLVIVETDKATLEVEAPGTGILSEILVETGEVAARATIGTIRTSPEIERQEGSEEETEIINTGSGASLNEFPKTAEDEPAEGKPDRIFASPRARRLATEKSINLSEIQGSGPRSMIVERDVQVFLDRKKTRMKVTPLAKRMAAAEGLDLVGLMQVESSHLVRRVDIERVLKGQEENVPVSARPIPTTDQGELRKPIPTLTRLMAITHRRKTIARRMQESHQTTAPVTLMRAVDATELKRLRELILEGVEAGDERPTYTDLMIAIVADCLLRHSEINATFDGEMIEVHSEVHMGLAVDVTRGLVVPVIRSAEKRNVLDIAKERARLVRQALNDELDMDELTGGTFTISNMGILKIDAFTPLINPPQTAILGIGRIHPVPAVVGGEIAIREQMVLSLTFDHRVIDGGPAARFLDDVTVFVEKPQLIWLRFHPANSFEIPARRPGE
jgi:pyruvate dehydrogenase E2 component (dihydrolipoamide acetyltransferase)